MTRFERERLGKRILVVEDDADIAVLLCDRLAIEGYETYLAVTGEAALLAARERRVHLIVLDLMLPDMDGNQVCARLREASAGGAQPAIIILTAKDSPADRLRGLASGADAYLTKPYDSRQLLKAVAHLLS